MLVCCKALSRTFSGATRLASVALCKAYGYLHNATGSRTNRPPISVYQRPKYSFPDTESRSITPGCPRHISCSRAAAYTRVEDFCKAHAICCRDASWAYLWKTCQVRMPTLAAKSFELPRWRSERSKVMWQDSIWRLLSLMG